MDPYLLWFIPVIGILIFVHELGHFIAAKAVGIGVPRFSIGFGKATPLRFQRGETEYMVAWVPLGGYVKMASREEQEAMAALEGGGGEDFPPEKLFENKPLWARILVISAGVIMNALFAWFLFSALAGLYGRTEMMTTTIDKVVATTLPEGADVVAQIPHGARITAVNGTPVDSWQDVEAAIVDPTTESLKIEFANGAPIELPIPGHAAESRARIAYSMAPLIRSEVGEIVPGAAAEAAGLLSGDRIVAVDAQPIESWAELVQKIEASPGAALELTIERDNAELMLPVVPEATTVRGRDGERTVGRIGIGQPNLSRVRFGFWDSIAEGWRRTVGAARDVVFAVKGLITRKIPFNQMGGPILIAQASGQVARMGLETLLGFVAFLSVNLAILNLLPIPVLDGGHLIFLFIEGLRRGKPLSAEVRFRLTQAGLVALAVLMIAVFYNDIVRLVTS